MDPDSPTPVAPLLVERELLTATMEVLGGSGAVIIGKFVLAACVYQKLSIHRA